MIVRRIKYVSHFYFYLGLEVMSKHITILVATMTLYVNLSVTNKRKLYNCTNYKHIGISAPSGRQLAHLRVPQMAEQ